VRLTGIAGPEIGTGLDVARDKHLHRVSLTPMLHGPPAQRRIHAGEARRSLTWSMRLNRGASQGS